MPIFVVIRYILSFLLLLGPVTLLSYLPFPQDKLRFGKKSLLFVHICLLSIYSVAESLLMVYLELVLHLENFYFIANMIRMGFMLSLLAVFMYVVKENILKKVIVFVIVYNYAEIMSACSGFCARIVEIKVARQWGEFYTTNSLIAKVFVTAVTLPFMVLLMVKVVKGWLAIMQEKTVRKLSVLLIVLAFIYWISYVIMMNQDVISPSNLILFVCLTLAVNLVYIMFFTVSFQFDKQRKLNEWADMAKYQMELEEIQYQNMIENMERARKIKHDFRHHMGLIQNMIDEGDIDRLKEYLNKYEAKNFSMNYEKVCNNFIVNSIARFYFKEAREKNIEVKHKFILNDQIGIDKVLLTTVFANLFENAIVACQNCKEIKPFIDIKVTQLENTLVIFMQNSCEEIRYDDKFKKDQCLNINHIYSLKRKGKQRGIGLSSIMEIVDNTQGTARFRFEENKFTSEICMLLNMES